MHHVRAVTVIIMTRGGRTHNMVLKVLAKPLALPSILCAMTEYPNSSVSLPRTGDSLAKGLKVSMVSSAVVAPHRSSKESRAGIVDWSPK